MYRDRPQRPLRSLGCLAHDMSSVFIRSLADCESHREQRSSTMASVECRAYSHCIPMYRMNEQATDKTRLLRDPFSAHGPFHIRYAAGELINQSGTFAAGIAWIASGIVQESCGRETTESAAVAEPLGSGDLLGIETLLPGSAALHFGSARAVTDVRLSFLERSAFEQALTDDTTLRTFVLERLAEQVFSLKDSLRVAAEPLETRLQRLIAQLAEKCARDDASGEVRLPVEIDRRALAEFLAVSTRRVSRALDALSLPSTDDGQLIVMRGTSARTA